jgi:hypothetical protein
MQTKKMMAIVESIGLSVGALTILYLQKAFGRDNAGISGGSRASSGTGSNNFQW